jgi:hypothetical protein
VEVNVKYILPTMGFIVLSYGDSVGGTRFLERLGNRRHGRHKCARKNALDVVNLCDVNHRDNEHVPMIPRLLVLGGEHARVLIAIRDDFGSHRA